MTMINPLATWDGPDEDAPPYFGECKDCGENLRTGIEKREELCYTCVRERTGA